ncbi:alpha-tectorin [Oryzias melastigma]|uniref:Alpha-tectorin-like n=1 Tax=Oryzias melastigma TaxID=30732 RepID=A0A3B3DSK2_ORYME|nr:alpha-tectorin [Oryzias melastigma]
MLFLLLAVIGTLVDPHRAEMVTGAGEVDLSACAITYLGQSYRKTEVSFVNSSISFCSSGENPDCLLVVDAQVDRAALEVVHEVTNPGSRIHQSLPNINSSSPCRLDAVVQDKSNNTHFSVSIYNFGKQTVLEVNVTSFFTAANIDLVVVIGGNPVKRLSFPKASLNGDLILDISGCRYSNGIIYPGESAQNDPTSCLNVTCSATADLSVSTKCGSAEVCHLGSGCVPRPDVCSVTASAVIDFNGRLHAVSDRCAYTLMKPRGDAGFHLLAGFRERRRRDVMFLDHLVLWLREPNATIVLDQGGEVRVNGGVMQLNETAQVVQGAELLKDQTGVTARIPSFNITVYFDGTTAHVAGTPTAVEGLCGNPSDPSQTTTLSEAKATAYSEPGCEIQHTDPVNKTTDCNSTADRCKLLQHSAFASCQPHADPHAYITACTDTLCNYPPADGLRCQFLKAYSATCSLRTGNTAQWREAAGCNFDISASCLDQYCSPHEFCGERNGDISCICRADFAYKHRSKNTLGDPAVCTQSSASLSLAICLLESKGVDYTSLHLKDQRCRGRVNAKSHMVTFGFSLNNTCGTEATMNGSQVLYTNTIMTRNRSQSVIFRHNAAAINFSCSFLKPSSRTLAFKVKESSIEEHIVTGIWNYTLRMNAYVDGSHTTLVEPSSVVELNQRIWMELSTEGLDDQTVAMVINSCWATDRPLGNDTARYDLIINGCPNPQDRTVRMDSNGAGTTNYFSFSMFEFVNNKGGTEEIYLHCKLEMCLKHGNSCIQNCKAKRRRRSLFRRPKQAVISMTWRK